ncbi:MAG TPA: PrgI family protein [Jatrophihabitans sp.]|nr:PrgI family protein [Jatrophihabitans sp.]
MTSPEVSRAVRIPADVEREDRIVAGLTARQVAIFAVAGLLLYAGYLATHALIPLAAYAALAVPAGVAVAVLVLGSRDGMSLDRLALAAARQRLTPRVQVAAPEGITPAPGWLQSRAAASETAGRSGGRHGGVGTSVLRLPADAVTSAASLGGAGEVGVVDLGRDGLAVVCACSTVNFALRTPSEQEALVVCFGRYLHALSAPVQILIRTHRLDLSEQITGLRERAASLPHPALESAALEHADYLDQLASGSDLLRRQVLLMLREPVAPTAPGRRLTLGVGRRATTDAVNTELLRAAQTRLARRVGETVSLLAPAGITVTALDSGQATAVLAAACNPDALIPAGVVLAGADDIITTRGSTDPYAADLYEGDLYDGSDDPDPYGTEAYDAHWPGLNQGDADNAAASDNDELWWAR